MNPPDPASAFWRDQLGINLALSAAALIMLDRACAAGAQSIEVTVIANAHTCTDDAAGRCIHNLGGLAAAW